MALLSFGAAAVDLEEGCRGAAAAADMLLSEDDATINGRRGGVETRADGSKGW